MALKTVLEAVGGSLPEKFEDCDLRFFSQITLTDAYNGKNPPLDGVRYRAILYGRHVVYEFTKAYMNGSGGSSFANGDVRFENYYSMAYLYLSIQRIARAKYFGEKIPKSYEKQSEDSLDQVSSSPKELEVLATHPQYQELMQEVGLTLEPTDERKYFFRVNVSKSAPKRAA